MITKLLAKVLSFALVAALCLTPASADFGQNYQINNIPNLNAVRLFRNNCQTDAAGTNGFVFNNFSPVNSEPDNNFQYWIIVGVIGEDTTTAFTVSSVTIDGVTGVSMVDQGATTVNADAAIWRSATPVSDANDIDLVVTFSEAVTGATACVWALDNVNSITPLATVTDEETASNALVLTLGTTSAEGVVLGVSGTPAIGGSSSWAVWTRQAENCNSEFCYAYGDANGTGGSMANTVDWSTTGGVGAGVSIR